MPLVRGTQCLHWIYHPAQEHVLRDLKHQAEARDQLLAEQLVRDEVFARERRQQLQERALLRRQQEEEQARVQRLVKKANEQQQEERLRRETAIVALMEKKRAQAVERWQQEEQMIEAASDLVRSHFCKHCFLESDSLSTGGYCYREQCITSRQRAVRFGRYFPE